MAIEQKESKRSSRKQAAREAIQSGKITSLLSLLDKGLMEEAIDSDGNTLLHLAVSLDKLPCIELLIENGADFNIRNKTGSTVLDIATSHPNSALSSYFSQLASLNEQLKTGIKKIAEAKPTTNKRSPLKETMYAAIKKRQPAILSKANSMSVVEKTLLNITMNELSTVLQSSQNDDVLVKNLQQFFRLRETFLENTALDYCFLPRDHICHALCYDIAELLCKASDKEDVYDVLLAISKCERRPSHTPKWRDYMGENSLPKNPGAFVRWHGEIHHWEQLLRQAVVNIISDSERSLDTIWLKTDAKNAPPAYDASGKVCGASKPGSLPSPLLAVLKQKGPACRELVDYTIERSTVGTVWKQFENLHKGLVQSSINGKGVSKGTEYVAGESGSEAIAIFFDWWNSLDASKRSQIGALCAYYHSGYSNTILNGNKSIAELLEQMRNPTLSASVSVLTCLDIISKHLKIILEKNINAFEKGVPIKSEPELEHLLTQALAELEKPPRDCVIYDSPLAVHRLLGVKQKSTLVVTKLVTAIEMTHVDTTEAILLNHPDLIKEYFQDKHGNKHSVRELLRTKAASFFMRFIMQNSLDRFKQFIELFPDALNSPINTDGDTLLIFAAFNGKLDILRHLLAQKGINVFATNLDGKMALQCAEEAQHIAIVTQLKTVVPDAFLRLIEAKDINEISRVINTGAFDRLREVSDLFGACFCLQRAGILTQENLRALLINAEELTSLPKSLINMHTVGRLTQESFTTLVTHKHLALCVDDLHRLNLCTQQNITNLLTRAQYSTALWKSFRSLMRYNLKTQNNVSALLIHAQHATDLDRCLLNLFLLGALTQENVTALLAQAPYAAALREGLALLLLWKLHTPIYVTILLTHARHVDYLSQCLTSLAKVRGHGRENIELLLAQAQHLGSINAGLASLQRVGIISSENSMFLLAQAPYAAGLGECLASLEIMNIRTSENIQTLLSKAQDTVELARCFHHLRLSGSLSPETMTGLLAHMQYASDLDQCLAILQTERLLTPDNVATLLTQEQHLTNMAQCLAILKATSILTPENITALLAQLTYAPGIRNCLGWLRWLQGRQMLTSTHFIALLSQAQHLTDIAQCLAILNANKIFTPENVTPFLTQLQYAPGLRNCLDVLHDLQDLRILTSKNFRALLTQAPHATQLAQGLARLNAAGMLTQEQFITLLQQAQCAVGFAQGMISLEQMGTRTQENLTRLQVQTQQHGAGLAQCWASLEAAKILTPRNYTIILSHASHAASASEELSALQTTGLLTQENFNALFGWAWYSPVLKQDRYQAGLGQSLVCLQQASLLTAENRQFLIEQAAHAASVSLGLIYLQQNGILNQTTFTQIIRNVRCLRELNYILFFLQCAKLLTSENFNTLLTQAQRMSELRQTFIRLKETGRRLLTQEDFTAVLTVTFQAPTATTQTAKHSIKQTAVVSPIPSPTAEMKESIAKPQALLSQNRDLFSAALPQVSISPCIAPTRSSAATQDHSDEKPRLTKNRQAKPAWALDRSRTLLATKVDSPSSSSALLAGIALKEKGLTLTEKDQLGNTPLLRAAANGELETVQWLLAHCGAQITEKSNYGNTALLQAARNGKLEMVQWLLCKGGAKITEKNNHNQSALDLASKEEVRAFLKTFKPRIQAPSLSGFFPIADSSSSRPLAPASVAVAGTVGSSALSLSNSS